jgi:stage III sporulation protein SpoIIIAA
MIKSVLKYFPEKLEKLILKEIADKQFKLEEIRLRVKRPIILKLNDEEIVIKYFISTEEILSVMQRLCENSIYSYQNEISSRLYNCKRWT